MLYRPAEEAVRVVSTPVPLLRATTVAFGTRAPVGSVTVPLMAPWPPVCAIAGAHVRPALTNRPTTKASLHIHRAGFALTVASFIHRSFVRITALLTSFSPVLHPT